MPRFFIPGVEEKSKASGSDSCGKKTSNAAAARRKRRRGHRREALRSRAVAEVQKSRTRPFALKSDVGHKQASSSSSSSLSSPSKRSATSSSEDTFDAFSFDSESDSESEQPASLMAQIEVKHRKRKRSAKDLAEMEQRTSSSSNAATPSQHDAETTASLAAILTSMHKVGGRRRSQSSENTRPRGISSPPAISSGVKPPASVPVAAPSRSFLYQKLVPFPSTNTSSKDEGMEAPPQVFHVPKSDSSLMHSHKAKALSMPSLGEKRPVHHRTVSFPGVGPTSRDSTSCRGSTASKEGRLTRKKAKHSESDTPGSNPLTTNGRITASSLALLSQHTADRRSSFPALSDLLQAASSIPRNAPSSASSSAAVSKSSVNGRSTLYNALKKSERAKSCPFNKLNRPPYFDLSNIRPPTSPPPSPTPPLQRAASQRSASPPLTSSRISRSAEVNREFTPSRTRVRAWSSASAMPYVKGLSVKEARLLHFKNVARDIAERRRRRRNSRVRSLSLTSATSSPADTPPCFSRQGSSCDDEGDTGPHRSKRSRHSAAAGVITRAAAISVSSPGSSHVSPRFSPPSSHVSPSFSPPMLAVNGAPVLPSTPSLSTRLTASGQTKVKLSALPAAAHLLLHALQSSVSREGTVCPPAVVKSEPRLPNAAISPGQAASPERVRRELEAKLIANLEMQQKLRTVQQSLRQQQQQQTAAAHTHEARKSPAAASSISKDNKIALPPPAIDLASIRPPPPEGCASGAQSPSPSMTRSSPRCGDSSSVSPTRVPKQLQRDGSCASSIAESFVAVNMEKSAADVDAIAADALGLKLSSHSPDNTGSLKRKTPALDGKDSASPAPADGAAMSGDCHQQNAINASPRNGSPVRAGTAPVAICKPQKDRLLSGASASPSSGSSPVFPRGSDVLAPVRA